MMAQPLTLADIPTPALVVDLPAAEAAGVRKLHYSPPRA